jgi:hypothetical protein
MDILQSMLNSQGTTVPPPSGPRTQGGIDVIVQEDLRIDSLPIMRLADLDANAMNVRPLTAHVVAATYNDRHVLVHTDKIVHDFVNDWVTQTKRLPAHASYQQAVAGISRRCLWRHRTIVKFSTVYAVHQFSPR